MKTFFFRFICLFILIFTVSPAFSFEFNGPFLKKMNIPCIVVSTINAEEPTGFWIDAPEGYTGKTLAGTEYVNGRMTVIINDSVYYDSGDFLAGSSGMRIKLRGNTSALWSKQPYKIKLSKKNDLFFRGDSKYKSKDWVLLNCPKVDLNTLVGFKVSELLGMEWTPRCRFVNLVLNDDYKGLYVLVESVEKDKGRINISDNGFVIEDDAYWWSEELYFKGKLLPDYEGYTFKYPEPDEIGVASLKKIEDFILKVENKLLAHDDDICDYLDMESFAKWLLAHDILGTSDGRGSNRYFYKNDVDDESNPMKIGPLWDFDNIFERENQWSQQHGGNYRFYYKHLLEYDQFYEEYIEQWNRVRLTLYDDISSFLDKMYSDYGEDLEYSRDLDSERWRRTSYNSLEKEMERVNTWMSERILWIDENIQREASVVGVYDLEQETDNGIWSLDGRRISSGKPLDPGLYIINGEKVLIRK